MPPAPAKSPSHRLSISESELQQLVSILDTLRSKNNITPELAALRAKCKNIIEKILSGIKTPDYIPTGRIASKNHVSLEMLGCTNESAISEPQHTIDYINREQIIIDPRIIIPRGEPHTPSDDEFAAAERELQEAIAAGNNSKRMSAEEWQEQRKIYTFLPEVQPE